MSHALDCPECGEDTFVRDDPEWGEDETEPCSDCGASLIVRIDDSDPEMSPLAYADVLEAR